MKCLVIGSNGMLGSTLMSSLIQAGIDVDSYNDRILTPNFHDFFYYDLVFNCIGAIPQKHPSFEQMLWVNSVFPRLLSRKANKVIHFSTDCVFSGLHNLGLYKWDDTDWATDDYGWTKRQGEIIDSPRVLTIRTSIIGHHGPTGLLEWFLYGDHPSTVSGYVNHYWNGFTTTELSNILIKNITSLKDAWGLWQLGGERISKYELLKLIASIYDMATVVKPDETAEVNKCLQSNVPILIKPLAQQLSEMWSTYTLM
jgi:dTDP-4-dehydrorhamnose reductase